MSSRRTLILVGAIVVGAIAALLILRYVGSVEDKASSDNHLVPVVVATGDVAKGTNADDAITGGLIEIRNRRQADLPTNVVTRIENIKGMVSTIDISPGSMITAAEFAQANDLSSSDSNQLDPGDVAITVSVDALHSAAGLVQPGDFVNILVDTADPANPAIAGEATVYQKAKVLAIGTDLGSQVAAPAGGDTTATTAAPQAASNLVTFEVPPPAAQVLAATSQKSLRLVLVRPDYQVHPIAPYSYDPTQPLPGDVGHSPYEAAPATAAPTITAGK
ncbi:MAG TPA: Flp pilus assembly protein CpaB [Acidimicrobiales bacterium]